MIAKASACPNCHFSGDESEAGKAQSCAHMEEYSRRYAQHTRNYAIYMIVMLGTGFIGLYTAYLWARVIYTGSIVAFLLIAVMTVLSLVGAGCLAFAKTLFPHSLHCPACDTRLDEIKLLDGACPGCHVRLE
jgi:hypothetical protein